MKSMFPLLIILLFIHNGNADTSKLYSFLVGISYDDVNVTTMFCTGSLIQINWVLTAGICMVVERKYFVTYTRSVGLQETYGRADVLKTILHPEYVQNDVSNNIGLMKIENVQNIHKFAQISIGDYVDRLGLPVLSARYWYNPSEKRTLYLEKLTTDRCGILGLNLVGFICVDASPDLKFYNGVHLLYNDTKVIGIYSGLASRFVPITDHYEWISDVREKNA